MTYSWYQKLADLVGKGCLLPPERGEEFAMDGLVPQAVVQPTSKETLSQVIAWAAVEKLAVAPRGGGTQVSLGNVPTGLDLVVDLSQLNRLLDYQPADLTATVEAGMTLESFQRELAQGGKFVPLEAPLSSRATIVGILAASSNGPLRHSYGLARDWLIGVTVIGSDGAETKAGGKVVKNVTGYDLNKLYTGSLGTLGIIVEATFKLSPLPTDSGALVAAFSSIRAATEEARNLLAQIYTPQGVQVLDARSAKRLELPVAVPSEGAVLVAFCSGRTRAVHRRLEQGAGLLQERGATRIERLDASPSQALLSRLTDFGWDQDTVPQLGLKINVPPSMTTQVLIWNDYTEGETPPGIVADPGFGNVKLFWWEENSLDEGTMVETITKFRGQASRADGSVVVEQCPLPVKQQIDVWGGSSPEVDVMRQIKQTFDLNNTLNPGRFMGRL